jgi:uncharacterized protein
VPDASIRVSRQGAAPGPIVLGFGAQGFRLDDGHHPALILTVDRATDWTPPPFESLDADALAAALDPTPEILLLGTGAALRRAPSALVRPLEARGIGVEVMDSRAAARAWGVLRGEGRVLAAALYPLNA